ncbi:queuosine precursor transporter [Candidatus Saccharibacteria bacterium]|nr:queuosine precursor transporter [Candidatus Saccharibacteria bacterium]
MFVNIIITGLTRLLMKNYKLLSALLGLNITFQLISDVTAGKIIEVASYPVSVTVLYFPVVYIISDVITEVYGYAAARRVLWLTLFASVTAGLVYQAVAYLPPADIFGANEAYRTVFLTVPRVLLGGWVAVFCGDLVNNYLMAKMKIWCNGRDLWLRTITSTIGGQFVNTTLFYLIALSGILPATVLFSSVMSAWAIKVLVEVVMTPVTYVVIQTIKRIEQEDYYDRETNFNPLSVR